MVSRNIFWIILIVFLYQNCGQELPNDNSSGSDQQVFDSQIGALDDEKTLLFKISNLDAEMNFDNGQIENSTGQGLSGQCLKQEKLNQIKALLEGNAICLTEHDIPADTLCAQVYTFPYLEVFIYNEKSRTKVGEKTSSCPSKTIHFCKKDSEIEAFFRTLSSTDDFEDCH